VVDRQQQQSLVEVIIEIRKELEEFLRASSPETYREEARAALRRILLEPSSTVDVDVGSNSEDFSVIDHLRERRVIHTWNKRQLARRRRELLSLQSNTPSAGPAEIHPPTSEQANEQAKGGA
jgi:hypothetical protein